MSNHVRCCNSLCVNVSKAKLMFQLFCEMWLVALLEVVLNFGCFVCLCCIEVLSYFTVTVNPKSSIGLRDRNTDFNFYCALILVGEKSFSFF